MTNLIPFIVDVSQATLDHILNRVRETQWPARLDDGQWGYGASYDYMRELADYWVNQYDWRKAEENLNRFPQFKAKIEDLDIHFYHVEGKGPNPLPLILTHGWPGSVFEFVHLIEPLTAPTKFGGDPNDAFTVVIPSLPGYGFSAKPQKPIGTVTTARLWNTLMTEVLGYQRYGAQGGDLGSLTTAQLASHHPDSLVGAHFNVLGTNPGSPEQMTEEERAWSQAAADFVQRELTYFFLQAQKPMSPAFGLADSPVGLAAWLTEKFKAWSDSKDGIETVFTKDQLLTMIMIYAVTNTIDSSFWFYRGWAEESGAFHPGEKITVPTGVALFPADLVNARPPRSIAERDYNIVHWTEMPKGGHFAALEQPELFLNDVRTFFRQVRA